MNRHYFIVRVVSDDNGVRADFDPVYSPPLVESGIEGDLIPEGAETVVVWASPSGLSDDLAERVIAYWNDTFTSLGVREEAPAPVPEVVSRKVALPLPKAKGEDADGYLDRVLAIVAESVETAQAASVSLVE